MEDFDLIYVSVFSSFVCGSLSVELSCRRVHLVMFSQTISHNREKVPFDRYFERWMHGQYTAVAAASEGIAKHVRTLLPDGRDRVRVVWNGTDIQRFQNARPIDRRELFDNDDRILTYTAR